MANHWLFKTEPSTYSYADLKRDKRTNWNGIRNFQARNHLKATRSGDRVLIYHTGDEKQVVGVARVVGEPYAEGEWVQVDIAPEQELRKPVPLSVMRQDRRFSQMPLLKQSRLSVSPLSAQEFSAIVELGTR